MRAVELVQRGQRRVELGAEPLVIGRGLERMNGYAAGLNELAALFGECLHSALVGKLHVRVLQGARELLLHHWEVHLA